MWTVQTRASFIFDVTHKGIECMNWNMENYEARLFTGFDEVRTGRYKRRTHVKIFYVTPEVIVIKNSITDKSMHEFVCSVGEAIDLLKRKYGIWLSEAQNKTLTKSQLSTFEGRTKSNILVTWCS